MSVCITPDHPEIHLRDHITLVNGRMAFGFEDPAGVASFFHFCAENPTHEFVTDSGYSLAASQLLKHYIEPGKYTVLSQDDIEGALREYGWLRKDDDGAERMHDWRN